MQSRSTRIAAIHDLSCFGRSSLTVVMPLFAKMNIQVCPLPTAILSTHGAYENGTFLDLTSELPIIIEHWKKLNLEFDAIYTGFLGSGDQIDIVVDFINKFSCNKPLIVVDPVMGDEGEVYSIIDSSITSKMNKLIRKADIITPNTTEAFVMLNKKYKPKMNIEEAKKILKELADLGPNIVILTSIHNIEDDSRYTGVYDKKCDEYYFDSCEYIPVDFPGTGDAFTSIFIGSILKGYNLKESLSHSLRFIESALKATISTGIDPQDGINLEIPQINF